VTIKRCTLDWPQIHKVIDIFRGIMIRGYWYERKHALHNLHLHLGTNRAERASCSLKQQIMTLL